MIPTLPSLTIDVWADIACPWCWIGERRLRRALEARPALHAHLRWRPFLLQPDLPASGMDWADFIERKFGGMERAAPAFRQVQQAGSGEGVEFRFDRMRRAPATGDAHRLILAAQEVGMAWEMAGSLFRAHFTDGMDLNDRQDLLSAASRGGLDQGAAAAVLDGDPGVAELREGRDEAVQLGIQGVPFFVFGNRYAISGAHPPEAILQAVDATLRDVVLQS